jgi:uncharacterized membrane protein YfcA
MSVKSPLRLRRRTSPEGGFLGGLLDPSDKLSETIFSILILLTFTLAFRVLRLSGNSGQVSSSEHVNELLIGALGAVLAWGVIDGVMYALFLLRHNDELAIRASNLVSFVVLFIVGYHWGKYTGANPWKTGLLLTTVAVVMVLIAIPLGG